MGAATVPLHRQDVPAAEVRQATEDAVAEESLQLTAVLRLARRESLDRRQGQGRLDDVLLGAEGGRGAARGGQRGDQGEGKTDQAPRAGRLE
jgi:hypothetical protein